MHRHKGFPLSFVTTGKHVLFVGGGELGESRLETALHFDWARITLVATDCTEGSRACAASDDRIRILERAVEEADVETADLVIENTMDEELAAKLACWCRPRRIPLNAMDKLDYCDVYYSALIMRGTLLLTINSSGDTPALVALLRRLLEQRLGPGWCNAAAIMAENRRALPKNAARMKLMKDTVADPTWLELMAANDIQGMRDYFEDARKRMGN